MKLKELLSALILLPALGQAEDVDLISFLEHEGCTIGAPVLQKAAAQGIDLAEIENLTERSLAVGQAKQERDWVVLDDSICTIRLPKITPRYTLDDPSIAKFISAPDAYPNQPGCYLDDLDQIYDVFWFKREKAFQDFFSTVAGALIAGDIAFFSDEAQTVPAGYLVIDESACPTTEYANQARLARAGYEERFSDYVRFLSKHSVCDSRVPHGPNFVAQLGQQDNPNAWFWMEYYLITAAAGWREGLSYNQKGVNRPPLCSYKN
ncbi:hypothetical protein [Epibacterium ulvae]|uniref:hypothetical protein n=1 Tax=Epibacterium ulvae TaxID=1156985 RepID=UPI0024917CE2|nr:hypothetical protein [Epibacterium ulvae]